MQSGQPIPLVFRFALLVLALVAASHFFVELYPGLVCGHGRGASFGHSRLGDYARAFAFLETAALVHRRLAMAALAAGGVASRHLALERDFELDVVTLVNASRIDGGHRARLLRCAGAGIRRMPLVCCVRMNVALAGALHLPTLHLLRKFTV